MIEDESVEKKDEDFIKKIHTIIWIRNTFFKTIELEKVDLELLYRKTHLMNISWPKIFFFFGKFWPKTTRTYQSELTDLWVWPFKVFFQRNNSIEIDITKSDTTKSVAVWWQHTY